MDRKVEFLRYPAEVKENINKSQSARSMLRRLQKGTGDTERSWFYEKKSPQWILSSVIAALDSMKDWEQIAEWDKSKEDKFQPQGGAAPFTERLEKFNEYFIHLAPPAIFKTSKWKRAKTSAINHLGLNGTGEPLTVDEVINKGLQDNKLITNSGYPLFLKRKTAAAIAEAKADYLRGLDERFPFMTATRAQMGKTWVDARFIFPAPMAINCGGSRFSSVFQEYCTQRAIRILSGKDLATCSARDKLMLFFVPWLGWDKVQAVISECWGGDTDLRFGADYTKMDQHFNKYHAMEAFDVIKRFFSKEWWPELQRYILYPFTAPVITSEGYVDQEHSLLSGSEWTNLLETVFNFILFHYLLDNGFTSENIISAIPMGIGDDQLWLLTYKAGLTFEEVRDEMLSLVMDTFEAVGLPGNPTKQDGVQDQDTSAFLQRKVWTDYNGPDGTVPHAGVYPLIRNLTSQVFPERYFNAEEYGWEAFAIRVIMIAENCNTHPLFEWYVKFIANANRNILRFVRLTDQQVDDAWESVKNIAGFRPTYNQEKQDRPLREFDTFRLLRKIASSNT